MKDAIRELLKGKNFTTVLNEYGLFKYELLDAIGDKIFRDYSSTPDEIETLKSIYTKEAIMFNLNAQKIMLISDTHMENKHHENLNYLDWAFEFCKQNNIHCLIHGGDIGDGTEPGTYKPLEFSEVPPGKARWCSSLSCCRIQLRIRDNPLPLPGPQEPLSHCGRCSR